MQVGLVQPVGRDDANRPVGLILLLFVVKLTSTVEFLNCLFLFVFAHASNLDMVLALKPPLLCISMLFDVLLYTSSLLPLAVLQLSDATFTIL